MRISPAVLAVLRAFLAAPNQHCFGYGVMQDTNLPAGTVYPILVRLEEAGWATTCDHGPDPDARPGRPPRRCYELTELGVVEARKLIGEAREEAPPKGGASSPGEPSGQPE
jgi:hypothetical protein